MKGPSTLTLVAGTVVLGVLAGALLVRETAKPIDASRLVPVRRGATLHSPSGGASAEVPGAAGGHERAGTAARGKGSSRRGRIMVASRRAVRDLHAPVTFTSIASHLFSKRPPPYQFREEVYEPKARRAALDDTSSPEFLNDPPAGWDADWPDEEVHLWSDQPPGSDDGDGEVEIMDILMYDLPLFIIFMGLLLYVEVTACLWRRGRDFLLATAAWRGNDEAFKAQCAKESQIMIYRPFATWFAVIGLWMVIKDSMDVAGKCFFNWDCYWNLDCHVRILIPAEAECVFDIMLPAAVVTGVLVSGVLAAVWGFTRPWAALVLLGTFATGVFAIWTVSLFVCTLW
jgi:hypothetical protein